MAKQVFKSKLAEEIVRVVGFKMVVTGSAVIKEGVELAAFLESQDYVIEPTNAKGSVIELTIGDISEVSNEAAVIPSDAGKKAVKAPAAPKKRTMSAAARAKIAAAQKKRWAKVNAAKKAAAAPKKVVKKAVKKAAPKKAVKKAAPKKPAAKKVKVTVTKIQASDLPAATAGVTDHA